MEKERIYQEIDNIVEDAEPLAFFAFTVTQPTDRSEPLAWVTFICDKPVGDTGEAIQRKLFELADLIKLLFFKEETK